MATKEVYELMLENTEFKAFVFTCLSRHIRKIGAMSTGKIKRPTIKRSRKAAGYYPPITMNDSENMA